MRYNIVFIVFFLFLFGCNQKQETKKEVGPQGPTTIPNVTSMGGGSVLKKADNNPVFLQSQIILNDLDEPVADNYEFEVYGEDTGIPNFPSEVSIDGAEFTDKIVVNSSEGRIRFFAKVPTKSGQYRILAKPKRGVVLGRFFVTVEPGPVSIIGEIKGTTYEDIFPYNGRKDPNEFYTLIADGQASTFVYVEPILDAFGNTVNQATIRMSIDQGSLLSANPTGISDGLGIFRIEGTPNSGFISILAEALDSNGNVIAANTGSLQLVRPNLTIEEDGDFGLIFVNQMKTKNFILSNTGSTAARNLIYTVSNPFIINRDNSSCLTITQLRPGEQCTLSVDFNGGIRQIFNGNLTVTGSPNSVSTASISKPIRAQVSAPANLVLGEANVNLQSTDCGVPLEFETYVQNTGDLPGLNLRANQPKLQNGQTRDVAIILPEADTDPSPDPFDIINCGDVAPPGRKCRVIVRHSPTALYTIEALVGSLEIDGANPATMTVRAPSNVGQPQGLINVVLRDQFGEVISGLDVGDTQFARVIVGPVQDLCNNPINNYPVSTAVTAGNVSTPTLSTNNGFTEFAWFGSSDVNDIGIHTIEVRAGDAIGSKQLVYKGVKLIGTPISGEIGQILRVNYIPQKVFFYQVKNEGTIPARNLGLSLEPQTASAWFSIDFNHEGGCKDGILEPGESCTYRSVVDTQLVAEGPLLGTFSVSSFDQGLNQVEFVLSGNAVNAPNLSFDGGPAITMTPSPAGTTPTRVVTLRNNSYNATALDLNISVAPPFEKLQDNCPINLGPQGSCNIEVRLPIDTRGTYSTTVRASSEFSSVNLAVTGTITSAAAAGTIPISFDKASVPASPTTPSAFITVSIGPIRDQYNNIVTAGTPVRIVSDKGQMNIDPGLTGSATVVTGSGPTEGRASFQIRARSFSEITDFTIQAFVLDGSSNVLASGSRSGSFTGSIISFNGEEVDFGSIAVGALDFRTLTLRNLGNETATGITWNTTSSDFVLSGQGGCTSLSPGASCNVTVLINPIQVGTLTGSVNVNSVGNGILSDTIILRANAVLAAKIVAGNNYDAPSTDYQNKTVQLIHTAGSPSTGSFKIRNVGQENLLELASSINNRSSEFSLSFDPSCQTLGFNQECNVNVSFLPTTNLGAEVLSEVTLVGESPSRVTVARVNLRVESSQLIFITETTTIPNGGCGAFRVQMKNNLDQAVNVPSNLVLGLSSSLSGQFHSDSSCTNQITSTTIMAGTSQTPMFYYRSTVDGDHSITVSNGIKSVQTLAQVFRVPQISPAAVTLEPGGTQSFSTVNGVNPFSYEVLPAVSGGTINASNGSYTAPLVPGTYSVRVTDKIGNTSTASITVEAIKMYSGRFNRCTYVAGQFKCIGENAFGQYGNNIPRKGFYNEPIPVVKNQIFTTSLGGQNPKQMFMGMYASCMTRSDDRLYCQGANHEGQIGDSSFVDRNSPVSVAGSFSTNGNAKAVSLSNSRTTCAVRNDSRLYCWGDNSFGQMGRSLTTKMSNVPLEVTTSNNVVQVATGYKHTCALLTNGQVVCFGDNSSGQLGQNDSLVKTPGTMYTVLDVSGSLPLPNIREITAGRYHTCAIDNSNRVYCWGRNANREIGNNSPASAFTRPIFLNSLSNIRNIQAGAYHTCAINNSGALFCWGRNSEGQLGLGNTNLIAVPTAVGSLNSQVTELNLGEKHTCVIHQANKVKCMGENKYGVLAQSNLNSSNLPVEPSIPGGNFNCINLSTFEPTPNTCRCSASANVYSYENGQCSLASFTNVETTPIGPPIRYRLVGEIDSLGHTLQESTLVYSNIPVNYSVIGDSSIKFSRIITDKDYSSAPILPSNVSTFKNEHVKGSSEKAYFSASIGDFLNTTEFRLYKRTCQQYLLAYGDLSSGQVQGLNSAGTGTIDIWCRFISGTVAYTFDNVNDYNRDYYVVVVNEGSDIFINCPTETTPINVFGKYYVPPDSTNSVQFFGLADIARVGKIVSDDLVASPDTVNQNQVEIQWQCQ